MAQDKKYISPTLLKHFLAKLKTIFAAKTHTHNYAGSSSAGGSANSAVKLATGRNINGVKFDGTVDIDVPTSKFNPIKIANKDLNTVTDYGIYYAGGGNGCTNLPSGVDAFGLVVIRSAEGYDSQLLYSHMGSSWLRQSSGETWTAWTKIYTSKDKPTPSEIGAAAASHGTHVTWATVVPKANGTAATGTSAKVAREDHVHPSQSSVSGNAGTATKLQNVRKIGNASFDGTKDISLSEIGAAASSHGTHVTYSTTAPKANGTAAVGTASNVSRGDHVHPLQTTVSGNAGSATKLQTARKIGNASFDGTKNITLSAIGAAPSSHTHTAGTKDKAGFAKLYDRLGTEVDGTMTQKAITSAMNNIDVALDHTVITLTLKANSWTGTAAPFKQTISNVNIGPDDIPFLSQALYGVENYNTVKQYKKAYDLIFSADTGDHTVTFTAYKKPTIDFDVILTYGRNVTFKKALVENLKFGTSMPSSGINFGKIEKTTSIVLQDEPNGICTYGDLSIDYKLNTDSSNQYLGQIQK